VVTAQSPTAVDNGRVGPVGDTGRVDDLFAPPAVAWRRVSPRLAVLRRGLVVAWTVVGLVLLLVGRLLLDLDGRVVAGVALLLLALAAWGWRLVARTVARWGYVETAEELTITRGSLHRRLVVVPYGRMQYVDVTAGPLDQLLGLATVQLHTASPGTTAVIPGLLPEEAARLRDRLTARGEAQAAGL
jgi:membrane protein YdbS with pleckstrin-like domain